MKVTRVETLHVTLPLEPPIASALGKMERLDVIPIAIVSST